MDEGLMLAMKVGQEMLSTFGQILYGFEIDDLAGRIGNGGIGV